MLTRTITVKELIRLLKTTDKDAKILLAKEIKRGVEIAVEASGVTYDFDRKEVRIR